MKRNFAAVSKKLSKAVRDSEAKMPSAMRGSEGIMEMRTARNNIIRRRVQL